MEQEVVINGVRITITDPKAIEVVNRALLREAEAMIEPKIASAVEAILKESGTTLNGRRVLITTGDEGRLKAEISGGGGASGGGRYPSSTPRRTGIYPSNTPKCTRIYDPKGQVHEFPSNHASFMWITSTYEVECDRDMKHNYMSVLEKLGVLEAKGFVDGWDTYRMK